MHVPRSGIDCEKNSIVGERGARRVWKREDFWDEKDDICKVIRPRRVLFVADLVSNGPYLSVLPVLPFFPPFYLAALQIHCKGQVWRPTREGRKNRFPLYRRMKRVRAGFHQAGKGRFTLGRAHMYVTHLDPAHPGSVLYPIPMYASQPMIPGKVGNANLSRPYRERINSRATVSHGRVAALRRMENVCSERRDLRCVSRWGSIYLRSEVPGRRYQIEYETLCPLSNETAFAEDWKYRSVHLISKH